MAQGPVLLHVGLHKTGSTWFQQRFLPATPGLAEPLGRKEILRELVYPGPGFDADRFWGRFEARFEAAWDAGRVAVVSHENLAGLPAMGGLGAEEMARRLRAVFPDAHAWMQFREQRALALSLHNQYVKQGGRRRLRAYVLRTGTEDRGPLLPAYLDHAGRHRMLLPLFGKRLRMVPYERFREDPGAVMADVLAPWGLHPALPASAPANRSLSRLTSSLLRLANHVVREPADGDPGLLRLPGRLALRRTMAAIDRTLRLRPRRPARWMDAWARTHFVEGNRELGADLDLDLSQYGYI